MLPLNSNTLSNSNALKPSNSHNYMVKVSVIITAFKEPKTIGKAIQAILKQLSKNDELLVVAPDKETLDVAKKISSKEKRITLIQDDGHGKPAAMNLATKKSKGDILIWTDGDIYISEKSISELLKPFTNTIVGAVTGRPISIDSQNTKYGFWGHILSEVAHERRLQAMQTSQRIFCSGYLFAIKKSLMPKLPEELLSEDGYISHIVYQKKYKIAYAFKANAFITYPKNFSDWIKQKRRSVGGYNQNYKILGVKIRSFTAESKNFWQLFKYIKLPKHLFWILSLFIARVYLWMIIYRDINLKNKSREELWVRVDSTK